MAGPEGRRLASQLLPNHTAFEPEGEHARSRALSRATDVAGRSQALPARRQAGVAAREPLPQHGALARRVTSPIVLQVTLRDERTHQPIPAATLLFRRGTETSAGVETSLYTADSNGLVRLPLEPLGASQVTLAGWSDELASATSELDLDGMESSSIDLLLRRATPVAGRVIDAKSGRPIPMATLSFWTFQEFDVVHTALDGSFSHPRFPLDAPAQQLRVEADGYAASVLYLEIDDQGRWSLPSPTEDSPTRSGSGIPFLEIGLKPELVVTGRVLDSDGEPLSAVSVEAEGYFRVLPSVASCDRAETTTDARGRFELRGLRGDIAHTLAFVADGRAERIVDIAPCDTGLSELADVRLGPEALLAGVVLDAEGFPVEDVEIVLLTHPGSEPREPVSASIDVTYRSLGRERSTRTCAAGTFVFEGLAARPSQLAVFRDSEPLVEQDVLFDEALGASTELILTLPPSAGILRGRVAGGTRPRAGMPITVRRFGHVGTVTTDGEGSFRVAGVDLDAPYELSIGRSTSEALPEAVAWANEFVRLELAPSYVSDY